MPDNSARIDLPYLMPAQAQKHVTHNEALLRLDAVTQLCVEGFGAQTPPPEPAEGETHALGGTPVGAWAGEGGRLAYWDGTVWLFLAPGEGWRAWGRSEGELRVWHDGAWRPAVTRTAELGINTGADAVNRLAVASGASLFTHAGAGHQIKVNKATPGDTASLLFQTGWSGRAEMGTAGTEDFAVKVSADGAAWTEALRIAAADGLVSLPQGAQVDGVLTGTAVQASAADATANRLMRVGAFGLGSATVPTVPGDDFNASTITGWSRNANVPVNAPRTWVGQMVMTVRGFSDSFFQLSAIRQEDQVWFRRANTDGVPGSWRALVHSGNIVGTLGVANDPRVIERGANANGDYVRLADGTQICWRSLTGATGAGSNWTFPATFSAPPVVTGNAVSVVLSAVCLDAAPGVAGAVVSARNSSGARRADVMHLQACGRWF